MRTSVLMTALLAGLCWTSSAVASKTSTGPLALAESDHGLALPATGVRYGRTGTLPSVLVEIRMDGVAVDGEPVLVLREGVPAATPGDEYTLRPVYERAFAKVGLRQGRGAEPPFLAVLAVDARVPATTVGRVLQSGRFAGLERVLFLVDDAVAREPWTPRALPDGAKHLEDPRYDVIIDVSREGFVLTEAHALLSDRDQRGLTCAGPCASVGELPWEALDRTLGVLAEKSESAPLIRVVTREADLPAGALIRAVGLAGARFDVVNLSVLPDATAAGGLPAIEQGAVAEPISLSGKLVGVSAVLEHNPDGSGVAGIPEYAMKVALSKVAGRTRGCVAQAGPEAEITLRLEIDDEGEVAAATVVASSVKERSPGQCLLTVVRGVSFPEPIGTTPFVTTWTFSAREPGNE